MDSKIARLATLFCMCVCVCVCVLCVLVMIDQWKNADQIQIFLADPCKRFFLPSFFLSIIFFSLRVWTERRQSAIRTRKASMAV